MQEPGQSLWQTFAVGIGGMLPVAALARVLYHYRLVRIGSRRFWSRELLWEASFITPPADANYIVHATCGGYNTVNGAYMAIGPSGGSPGTYKLTTDGFPLRAMNGANALTDVNTICVTVWKVPS